jgi:hypothetical protein
VANYISFRMRAAGYRGPDVFAPRALALVTRASDGLTRRINILADKALLAAFTESAHAVTDRQVRAAIADSEFAAVAKPRRSAFYVGAALAAGLVAGGIIQWAFFAPPAAPPAAPVAPIAQAPVAPAAAPVEPAEPPAAAKVEPAPAPAAPEAPATQAAAPSPQATKELQRRFAGYSPRGQKLLAGRLAATRELLERAPGERYALELFWTDNTDPARMERFLQRAADLVPLSSVYVLPSPGAGSYRLRVLYGDFASLDEALVAAMRLPPRYQQAFRAVPRTLAELRGEI